MKSSARLIGPFASEIDNGRGHRVVTDLPAEQSGGNAGPTALELCVMSFAGCLTTIWALVARNSGVAYESFRVEVEADKPQGAKTLAAVRATAFVKSAAEADRLERILEKTVKVCPVGVLLEQAGVKIEHHLTKE